MTKMIEVMTTTTTKDPSPHAPAQQKQPQQRPTGRTGVAARERAPAPAPTATREAAVQEPAATTAAPREKTQAETSQETRETPAGRQEETQTATPPETSKKFGKGTPRRPRQQARRNGIAGKHRNEQAAKRHRRARAEVPCQQERPLQDRTVHRFSASGRPRDVHQKQNVLLLPLAFRQGKG